jgi:hypothetical protein
MKSSIRSLAGLSILVVCAASAIAQTNRGGISGTVFDSTGSVVSGATVTITNVGTNHIVKLTTSTEGAFTATALDPVVYSVTVEAAGFKKAVVNNVKVDTATTANVNVTLQPGGVETVIDVTADTPLLNTVTGTPGQTITERQISEMPLNNRSVLDLVLTVGNVSGVAGTEDPELGQDIPAPGFNVNINGGRAGSTSILADGANNTGVGLGRAVVTFSPDTVQEFTVQTANFSAEFGQTGGGVVNLTTKSGTNQFNGLAYWYHRNPVLNAAPFTINATNRPVSNRRQSQFGLIYGGPIVLPKKVFGPLGYDGHDKSFFFVAVEPRYYYDGNQGTLLMPTPEMLRGDFSNVVAVNGGYAPRAVAERFGLQTQIRDATVYNQWVVQGDQFRLATLPTGGTYPVFPNNVIPQNMLDPTSVSLLKFLPKAGDYFIDNGNLRNYVLPTFIKDLEKRVTVRLDHQISNSNRIYGRYTQVPVRGDRGRGDFQVGRDEINSGGTDYSWSKQALISDTHTFSPTVINELRLNYTYGRFTKNLPPAFDALTGRNFSTELGLPSVTPGGLPEFTMGPGVAAIGWSLSQQNENAEHSYEIADNISWVRGNMSWKFGAQLLQQRLKTIPLFGASGGRYEFGRNRTLTNSNGNANSGTGGVEFAQFLMGTYNLATLREVLIPYYYQWNSAAAFVQNDWRVKPNLTLNLGMRYTLQLPRTEKYDRQGVFMPELAQEFPLPAPVTLPNGRVITTALVPPFAFSGRGGRSRYITPVEKLNFEPRFGLAWTPKIFGLNKERDRLVIRGGYGISHAPLTGTNRNPSPDFAAGTTGFGTLDNRVQNPGFAARICCNKPILSQVAPDAFLNIPQDGLIYLNSINLVGAASAISSDSHLPYVQSWSATLAYELPHDTVIELSYNGSKGTHLLLAPTNVNQIPTALADAFIDRGINPINPNVTDPLGRRLPTGALVNFSPVYLGAKYLGFEAFNEAFNASANSIRHAGTVSVLRRHNRGLSYTANYTFGKGLDDASDSGDVRFVNLNVRSIGHVNYGAPRSADRSVSLFDIKHVFSASFLWDVPVGQGRSYLRNAPGIVENLIGGWSLSGIGRIQGGIPLVTVLRDDNGIGVDGNVRAIRPDLVPGVSLINPRWDPSCPIGQGCEPYFNPAAFMRPIKGTLGNAPRTLDGARAPTQHFFDLSLQKNFPLGKDGKRRLQFRVDAINVFNHPIFRMGTLEDAGEIFAAPNENPLTNAEYDAWAAFSPTTRPARTTTAGAAMMTQINQVITSNRIPGTQALRRDFFHVPPPEGFFSMNANQFDLTTVQGVQLYRLRQAYTPDRWGFLQVTGSRSAYTPRFIQIALKFYF